MVSAPDGCLKKQRVKPVVGFMGVGIEAGWSKTKEVATIKDVPTK